MIEALPLYVAWIFTLTTDVAVILYLHAASRSVFVTASVLVVLLGVHGALALNGFYLADATPPRFPLAPFPTIVFLLGLYFATTRKDNSVKSLQSLTLLSTVRVPVELVLLWLYQHEQIPQVMTFEGRNLDILSGLTAPLVAWLAFRGGVMNRPLLLVWNLVAFCLLLCCIFISICMPLIHLCQTSGLCVRSGARFLVTRKFIVWWWS